MTDKIFIAFGNSEWCGYCKGLKEFIKNNKCKRIMYYDETSEITKNSKQIGGSFDVMQTASKASQEQWLQFLNRLLQKENPDFGFIPKIFEVDKNGNIVRRPDKLDSLKVMEELG